MDGMEYLIPYDLREQMARRKTLNRMTKALLSTELNNC